MVLQCVAMAFGRMLRQLVQSLSTSLLVVVTLRLESGRIRNFSANDSPENFMV